MFDLAQSFIQSIRLRNVPKLQSPPSWGWRKMVACKYILVAVQSKYTLRHQLLAKALLRSALNGRHIAGARGRAFVNHKPFGGVFADAVGLRPFAIKQLWRLGLAIHLLRRAGQRLKNRLAQCGDERGGGLENLVAVRLQRRRRVGPRPGVAVLQAVAPGLGRL